MEEGKMPCTLGLYSTRNKYPNGMPSSIGGQGIKSITPVDCNSLIFDSFSVLKKGSSMNYSGDGGSGSMNQGLQPYGKLGAPDDRNKHISPAVGVFPLNSDQPGIEAKSNLDRSFNNPDMDPKKLKRILSNRLSAQKSRQKKFQYINEMERKVKALEAEIALLTPQVALHEHRVELLKMENSFLNQKLAAVEEKNVMKDAVVEQKREEVKRLKEVYRLQQQQMQGGGILGWNMGLMQN